MKKKETRGRKSLPESKFRGCLIACRMQNSEAAEIEEAAGRAGKVKSDWIREALLTAARAGSQEPPPPQA